MLTAVTVVAVFVAVTRASHKTVSLCQVATPSGRYQLSLDQAANAATIAAVGKTAGLPDHAVTVALAAALQESGLHNLDGGDRDSVGLFQQRPSEGWGTPAELRTPSYAAGKFFSALGTVPNWENLSVTEAAQAVQRSAAPDAYAAWEQQARAIAEALTGESPGGLACQFDPDTAAAVSGPLSDAMRSELGSASFTAASPAAEWLLASWLVAHASSYRITSVAFGTHRWASSKAVWTTTHADRSQLAVTVAGRDGLVTTSTGI